MSATAHDMSQHWRLVSAEAANDTHRVYGTCQDHRPEK